MRRIVLILLAVASVSSWAAAAEAPRSKARALAPMQELVLPEVDREKALADAKRTRSERGGAQQYGFADKFDDLVIGGAGSKAGLGTWTTLADGRRRWTLSVYSPNAVSLDFGFSEFFLPQGAELSLISADGHTVRGPYTDADNPAPGSQFWTPVVPGERTRIELTVPAAQERFVVLAIHNINRAFRSVLAETAAPREKSLACEIDVACPEGDNFRDPIASVARYTFTEGASASLCTGQLVNSTSRTRKALFETANHCVATSGGAASMVLYWRYQSATCRTPGGSASGIELPTNIAVVQTGGAELRATHASTDATLVELNSAIPAAAQPFWSGWDRRDLVPASAAVIHHPAGHEKRISLDFNPPVINTTPVTIQGISWTANASVNVTYDRGTTEGGSSGGGLFSPERRLIGQLGGGPEGSCTVGITDTYGRLAVSWEGGGTPASRFRDWLDDAGTNPQFLDGLSGCTRPTIALTVPATRAAGTPVTAQVTASGAGPFRVEWDVDGDGVIDRTQQGISTDATISPVYPTASSVNLGVRVVDSAGCAADASRALNVTAPDIVATESAPAQVCGDGDASIEPGERWRIPVQLTNSGGQALDAGIAVFSKGAAAGAGYQTADSSSGNLCGFQFIDTSAQAPQPLSAAYDDAPASDEGVTPPIALGPGGFNYFGQQLTSVVMSTNGYLGTSLADEGGDYTNDCPVDLPDRGSSGARFHVLHDDLALQPGGALRSRRFSTCPRASAVSPGVGCTVFTWSNAGQFDAGGAVVGNAEFQAVLYDQTNEIAYQYRTPDVASGGTATIGVQNGDVSQSAQVGCNQSGTAPANRAVCFFNPSALPAALGASAAELVTPGVAVPNLSSGQSATVDAVFQIPATASCGAGISVNYVGVVDDNAYSLRGKSILTSSVGGNGTCTVFAGSCPAIPAAFVKRDGLYSSFTRFGNGMAAFNIPTAGGTVFGGQWYTGTADRSPTWLILQGPVIGNQADVPVLRFRQTSAAPFTVTNSQVGRAQITYTSATDYVATWTVDGAAAGEKLSLLYGTARPSPNRTGSWFYAAESGWGLAVDDHILNGQPDEVIINYFYDAAGAPIWTLGGGSPPGTGTQPHNLFRVHCPDCPSLPDFTNETRPTGTVTYNYNALTTGTYTTNIQFPAPFTGSWNRSAVPIQMISSPAPQ